MHAHSSHSLKMFKCSVLLLIAFQAYFAVACDNFDYCKCMQDVNSHKVTYEKYYDQYYIDTKSEENKAKGLIAERLEGLKSPCSVYNDPDYYLGDLLSLCGGSRLSRDYYPIWRHNTQEGPNNTNRVCSFLVAKYPALCAQRENTMRLITTCKYMELFDKSIGTIIKACNKGCSK